MNNWVFRENNLDLIRLLAAMQVAVLHTFEFMFADKTGSVFFQLLRIFPGVPIFFFISGYLISKSYERSLDSWEYSKNRILRIFPALILCVLINLVMVWYTGYFDDVGASVSDVGILFLAKATFLQFYNPEFMRSFGDGVLNGSLWTICVELQFYILTPVLYLVFGKNRQIKNLALIILIVIFVILNRFLYILADEYSHQIWWKLYRVSFTPWIYMFLVGVLVQRNFQFFSKYISKIPFIPLLLVYVGSTYFVLVGGVEFGNSVSPLIFFPIAVLVFRAAYSIPKFSEKLLNGNDISYGIYIWHMPIVNQFLYYGWKQEYWHAILTLMISFVIAVISWFALEKPSLAFKKYSLKKSPVSER